MEVGAEKADNIFSNAKADEPIILSNQSRSFFKMIRLVESKSLLNLERSEKSQSKRILDLTESTKC